MSAADGDRSVRVVVQGRVQGVGYRAWCARTAHSLGLCGWVRNCRDGSVEAVVAGPWAGVGTFLALARTGPRAAAVTAVEATDCPAPAEDGFFVRETL